MSSKLKRILLVLVFVSSPSLWLLLLGQYGGIDSVTKWPKNIVANINQVYSAQNSQKVNLLHDTQKVNIQDRIFYNKITLTIDGLFSILSTISPQYLFTPIGKVEIIPTLLLPASLLWLVSLIRKVRVKTLIVALFLVSTVLFVTAPDNLCLYSILGFTITYYSFRYILDIKIDPWIQKTYFALLFTYQLLLISFVLS